LPYASKNKSLHRRWDPPLGAAPQAAAVTCVGLNGAYGNHNLQDETLKLEQRLRMELRQQIRTFLTSNFHVADALSLADATPLLEEGIIDSTGMLKVIAFIETSFDIAVEKSEMLPGSLDSIERIASFVARKKEAALEPALMIAGA
jgi:acyl carrier protein